MADTERRARQKRWAGLILKLVTGIGALSAGVERYVDLAEKNEAAYEALVAKSNSQSEELAALKGKIDVLLLVIDKELDHPEPVAAAVADMSSIGAAGGMPPIEETEKADKPTTMSKAKVVTRADDTTEDSSDEDPQPTAAEAKTPKPESKQMKVGAYEQLPANLEDLVQKRREQRSKKEDDH